MIRELWRRLRGGDPARQEQARQRRLREVGRIAGGELLDWLEQDTSAVVYQYEVSGVTYHCSQVLGDDQRGGHKWLPGSPVQVKYDPANPGNSIVL